MRSLYSHAHRNKILTLLASFKLETNIKDSQILLNAIQFMLENKHLSDLYYPDCVAVPIDKVISGKWLSAVVEDEQLEKNK